MPPRTYTKTFLPLESNPDIFTSLAHSIGLSSTLKFTEVYDFHITPEEEVLAYVLAFPTGEGYDGIVDSRESGVSHHTEVEKMGDETVLWLRQTIHNACGLYALLHVTCNGVARDYISTSSPSLPFSSLTQGQNQIQYCTPSSTHHHLNNQGFSPHPQIWRPCTPQQRKRATQRRQSKMLR